MASDFAAMVQVSKSPECELRQMEIQDFNAWMVEVGFCMILFGL